MSQDATNGWHSSELSISSMTGDLPDPLFQDGVNWARRLREHSFMSECIAWTLSRSAAGKLEPRLMIVTTWLRLVSEEALRALLVRDLLALKGVALSPSHVLLRDAYSGHMRGLRARIADVLLAAGDQPDWIPIESGLHTRTDWILENRRGHAKLNKEVARFRAFAAHVTA